MHTQSPGTVYNPFCQDASSKIKQKFLLTCLCVAGKNAKVQQGKVDVFCTNVANNLQSDLGIFDTLRKLSEGTRSAFVDRELRHVRMGQYKRITAAINYLIGKLNICEVDWSTATRSDLVACPGLGMKTASFYLVYSQGGRYAILDVHILKWLKSRGYNVPTRTPASQKEYLKLEEAFFQELIREGMSLDSLASFDFSIWSSYVDISIPDQ